MIYRKEIRTTAEISTVRLYIKGYGIIQFNLSKFPGHCGASCLSDVYREEIYITKMSLYQACNYVTDWLLNNRQEHINFNRSRIIAGDKENGVIAIMANDVRWRESNKVKNKQTGNPIRFYWLDRNK